MLPPEAGYFGHADGVVGIAHALVEGGELFVVFLEVLAKEEDFRGKYAVFKGVHFGGVAAFLGFEAGGFQRVGLVSGDSGSGSCFSIGGNLSTGCEEENGTVPF